MSRAAAVLGALLALGSLHGAAACEGPAESDQSAVRKLEEVQARPSQGSAPEGGTSHGTRLVHVIVALCDNRSQGIVPVAPDLGNGQSPGTNLYWGAMYGVRTYLERRGGWQEVAAERPEDDRILERIYLRKTFSVDGREIPALLVADAWDGREIKSAIGAFLLTATGSRAVPLRSFHDGQGQNLSERVPDLVIFVGHNGLMEFPAPPVPDSSGSGERVAAAVLACASKPYFQPLLEKAGARPLLLTTGLMAPEAYTLDAVISAWVSEASAQDLRRSAAAAYDRFQECGADGCMGLFWSGE